MYAIQSSSSNLQPNIDKGHDLFKCKTNQGQHHDFDSYKGNDFLKCPVIDMEKIIAEELELHLKHAYYEPIKCGRLCHDLCLRIRDKMKKLQMFQQQQQQHRLVVNVIIGQDSDQTVHLASRSVSDPRNDSMASAIYRNKSIFAIGLVHVVHLNRDGLSGLI